MTRQHEQIVSDDAPTPEQLRRLARIGTSAAAERERLRQLQNLGGLYFIDEIDFAGYYGDEADVLQVRHRIAGRVGVRAASTHEPKIWSLKLIERHAFSRPLEGWSDYFTQYQFEWTRIRAILAKKTLRIVGSPLDDLSDHLDQFSIRDDEVAMLHIREQFEQVTAGDCEDLIGSAQEYFRTVRSVPRR